MHEYKVQGGYHNNFGRFFKILMLCCFVPCLCRESMIFTFIYLFLFYSGKNTYHEI
jgi:hypothetical protein